MKYFLVFVLFFAAAFLANAIAQSQTVKTAPAAGNQTTSNAKPELPIALYECDGDQCERNPQGGSLWLFHDEKQGQGMWGYTAVAALTVPEFDGHSIHVHRADPAGSYSSQFVNNKEKEFFADYFGTISGDTIQGRVYWNGDKLHPGTWKARRVDDFCAQGAPACPLSSAQLAQFAGRVWDAGMHVLAYRCYLMAAVQGDQDAAAFLSVVSMKGNPVAAALPPDIVDLIKLSPNDVLAVLQENANQDGYFGELGLAQAFREGVIVAKDSQQATYWQQQADSWKTRDRTGQHSAHGVTIGGDSVGKALFQGFVDDLRDKAAGRTTYEEKQSCYTTFVGGISQRRCETRTVEH